MRVIVVNRFFHPDHSPTSVLLSDVVFTLRERGLPVTVITSRLGYASGERLFPRKETIRGVEIRRVWSSNQGQTGIIGRALDYASFYMAAAWQLWCLVRATDVVIAKTDPPLLSVMAAVITRLRGARLVNWLQDIFPEVAEALNVGGRAGKLCCTILKTPRNWSLQSANCNVVVGERMAEHLRMEGIAPTRIRVIPNWADGDQITPLAAAQNEIRKSWSLNDRFVVGYAGNLGRTHDVTTVIDAMTLLHEQAVSLSKGDISQRISFVFVGGGAQFGRVEGEAWRRGLTNVQFHPYQPRERLREVLGVADVHIVSLNPEVEGLIVPSKFYGIAAAGRPALFIGAADGEIARFINKAGCGYVVAPGDHLALVERIRQLAEDSELCARMGESARGAFEKQWDRRYGVERWAELLLTAAKAGKRMPDTSAPKPD